MSVYVTTIVSDRIGEYLGALERTGIYGDNLSEVAERLMIEGIHRAIERRLIPVINPPEPELEPEEAPPQRDLLGKAFKCTQCEDGDIEPPTLVGNNCGRCGADCSNAIIPF